MRNHTIVSRAGWSEVPAVQAGRIYEIPSTYILQPGPAAITDGLPLIADRLAAMYAQQL